MMGIATAGLALGSLALGRLALGCLALICQHDGMVLKVDSKGVVDSDSPIRENS